MKKAVVILLLFLLGFEFVFPLESLAGELTPSYIRLTRNAVSAHSGALVCAKTPVSDNGAENSVQIIFPGAFGLNSTSSNWSVTTTDLPTGASAWPGIGTATSVAGTTVTFPSTNLSTNTTYCFNISSTNTITNPSSSGSYETTIRTRTSGNATVDSIDLGIPIVTNDSVSVTATVPAAPTDFEAELSLLDAGSSFAQDRELSYRLQYGTFLSTPSDITVEAEWDLGTIQGGGIPTEDILNYVTGSASTGYNNTPPVVDLINRKITWTISSIPANTHSQIVTFRLRTNSSYTNTLPVTFSVHGRVLGPGTQSPDSTVTSNYYNSNYVTPTPAPTCIPSECPTPTPVYLSPTPVPDKLTIQNIEIRSIKSDSAQVFVASNNIAKVRIIYGFTPTTLNKAISSSSNARQHTLTLSNLQPATRYLFRVIVTDTFGQTINSGLYVLDTAVISKIPNLITGSLIISSGDVFLTSPLDQGALPDLILPTDTTYSFRFGVEDADNLKTVRAVLRPDNVLGTASNEKYTMPISIQTVEIKPGFYIGKLNANNGTGIYRLLLQISDYNGNIQELQAAKLFIVTPLTIINAVSKEGVENVKTTLYFYNYRLRKYEPLSTSLSSIKNPTWSVRGGIVETVLPEGKYKAELSVFGFKPKTVEFVIGPNSSNYPVIELTPLPFNLLSYIQYTFFNAIDAFGLLNNYIDSLKASSRYFELFTFGTILLFIVLAFVRLSRVLGVSPLFLPFFAFYHLVSIVYRPKHTYIVKGKVADVLTHAPLPGVLLYFAHTNGKVITHTHTNGNGEFAVSIKDSQNVKVTMSKKGYTPFSKTVSKEDLSEPLTVVMGQLEKPDKFGISTIIWYLESVGSSLFVAFLVLTLIIEIIFAFEYGWEKALLCIVISIGNILLWAIQITPKSIRRV